MCLEEDEQGLADYQKALALDPSLAFVHNNLGVFYFGLGNYEAALEEYKLSVAIDPGRAGAWDGMSEALERMGQMEECIQAASKAITIQPDLWLAYEDRGLCYADKSYYKSAVPDYKAYVTNIPDDSIGWYNYGVSLDKTGDEDTALQAYNRSLTLDPSYPPALINRGLIYNDKEQYTLAMNDFNNALKGGDIAYAYNGRGYTYLGLKQYQLAQADFEKSIQLYPNACSYCGLADIYLEFGKYQDSLDAASAANAIDPTCGGQHLLEVQARDYYGLEQYPEALSYINKALAKGMFSKGFYYRGIIEQAAGNNKAAISDLNTFLFYAESNVDLADLAADANARLAQMK
jgi:tetratricopeptide (TPR) repeat protein